MGRTLLTILFFIWFNANATNRIANSADAATLPNVNVGDYIIDVANGNPDVFINGRGVITISYPAKIVISADVTTSIGLSYGNITLNLFNCTGYDTSGHPLYITYYSQAGRHLNVTGLLRLYYANGVIWTGEYDPVLKLGNAAWTGRHGNWPFIIGKYGIQADCHWANTTQLNTAVDSNSVGVTWKGIEFKNGGFAPISLNFLNNGVDFVKFRFTDNLVYNRNGEGTYVGSTQADPERSNINLEYDDNIVIVTGNDGIQFDRLFWNVRIHNNVVICGGANWRNAFETFQDHGVQITITGNNIWFYKNIVLGGGEMSIQPNYKADGSKTPGADTNRIFLNVFYGARGPKGLYTGAFSYGTKAPLNIDSNYWGHFALPYDYDKVLTGKPNTQTVINVAFDTPSVKVRIWNNFFDGTKTNYIVKNGSPGATLDTGQNRRALNPWPQLHNFFGYSFIGSDTVHPHFIEIFSPTIGDDWSPGESDSVGSFTTYPAGQLLSDSSRWYKAKVQVRGNIRPNVTAGWATQYDSVFWNLSTGAMVLSPSSLTGLTHNPPLDVRLPETDPYAQMGIGLTEQIASVTRIKFRVRKIP